MVEKIGNEWQAEAMSKFCSTVDIAKSILTCDNCHPTEKSNEWIARILILPLLKIATSIPVRCSHKISVKYSSKKDFSV